MTTDKENVTTDLDIEWAKKEDKRSQRIFMCKLVAGALIGALLGTITYHKKK